MNLVYRLLGLISLHFENTDYKHIFMILVFFCTAHLELHAPSKLNYFHKVTLVLLIFTSPNGVLMWYKEKLEEYCSLETQMKTVALKGDQGRGVGEDENVKTESSPNFSDVQKVLLSFCRHEA